MKYFVKCGCVIPYDKSAGFNTPENLVLTVYPIENGEFTDTFFYDDGETFDYLENKCVKLNITVKCSDGEVTVFYENTGENEFTPKFVLADGDKRKLIVKEI